MINNINKFKGSNKQAVKKLNDIASAAGALRQLQGDGIINVKATPSGYAIALDVPRLFTLLPLYKRGAGGTDINIKMAYCAANAGSGSSMNCYLDSYGDGELVSVYCNIYEGGSDLSSCAPLLEQGDMMLVIKIDDVWHSLTTFIPTDEC